MPFTPINVVNGSTPANATWGNLVQTQYTEATLSLNQDAASASPFVLSGLACVKDTTTASKLNVGAGVAYLLQTDSTLRRRAPAATNFTTAVVSTTYYLDLNPDGTFSWGTAHSGVANYLPICSVTTDSSGNISGVTDARVFTLKLLTGGVTPSVKTPPLQLPAPISAVLTQSAANYGTVVGGVTFGQTGALAASMDGAALFNGTSGMIAATSAAGLPTGNGAATLEAWVRLAANPSATATLYQLGIGVGGQCLYAQINTTGTVQAANVTATTTASAALSLNVWHHIVTTFDGTNIRLYIDGALAVAAVAATQSWTYTNPHTFAVASNTNVTPGGYLGATIDEVAVYSGAALSLARVQAHYNAGTATASDAYATTTLADSPLLYYRLGDAAGSSVAVCTTTPTPTTLFDAGGTLKNIGGQASVGAFGAPVIIGQGINTNATSTGLWYYPFGSASATGLYRVSAFLTINNSVSGQLIKATVSYTDGNSGANVTSNMSTVVSGSVVALSGATTTVPNGSYALNSLLIYAKAGTTITFYYQDNGGTPNDLFSAILERLS